MNINAHIDLSKIDSVIDDNQPISAPSAFFKQTDGVKKCFHCLEPIPTFTNLSANLSGEPQPMCCIGCKAAAEFIDAQGLTKFYEHRDRLNQEDFFGQVSREQNRSESWAFLDDNKLSKNYLSFDVKQNREINILVQGLYCSSCSWLITRALSALSKDLEVQIDVNSKRVRVIVFDHVLSLSSIVETIENLGYQPTVCPVGDYRAVQIIAKQEQESSMKRLVVAGFGMMQVMTYAVATYFGTGSAPDTNMSIEHGRFLYLVSMLVATIVVFYSGKSFFVNAINDLKNKHLGMDVPVALAISGAYFPSVYQTLSHSGGHVYFDSAVMFVFFLLLGRHMEIRARHRLTGLNDDVQSLLPGEINVQRSEGGQIITTRIKPYAVHVGDQIELSANAIVPFDALIITGQAQVDEALITGESLPVNKAKDNLIVAGSKIVSGTVRIKAINSWSDSSVAKIERLLQSASMSEESEAETNRAVSQHFIIAVLITTAVVCVFWAVYQPARVFDICLAMLIASCPCAFSLAAPIARSAATHALRKAGVLLTNGKVLKQIPKITHWYFDKTGTLTKGDPMIEEVEVLSSLPYEECLEIAAAISKPCDHVFSRAFSRIQTPIKVTEFSEYAGCGISALIEEKRHFVGKREWVLSQLISQPSQKQPPSNRSTIPSASEIWLANQHEVLAVIQVQDQLRESAAPFLEKLHAEGAHTMVLSGDKKSVVASVCDSLIVDDFAAELLPHEKLSLLKKEQTKGHKIAMVGDGINDAPVLAQANVSVAMASGSELSQNNADVILVNGDLQSLSLLKSVALKTQDVTRQNISWAIAYNLIALPLAASGLLNPWIAALGMSLSSLLVVLNALRISRVVSSAKTITTTKQPDQLEPLLPIGA